MFQFLVFISTVLCKKHPIFGVPGERLLLVSRSFFGTIAMMANFTAIRLLPLSDSTTINFTTPFFVTVIAFFFLKEPCGLSRLIPLAGILTGVVIVAQPEFIFGSDQKVSFVGENRSVGTGLALI